MISNDAVDAAKSLNSLSDGPSCTGYRFVMQIPHLTNARSLGYIRSSSGSILVILKWKGGGGVKTQVLVPSRTCHLLSLS